MGMVEERSGQQTSCILSELIPLKMGVNNRKKFGTYVRPAGRKLWRCMVDMMPPI
jgi:hypothetical protein